MEQRRQFLKLMFGIVSVATLRVNPFFSLLQKAYAKTIRKILPKGTKMETLTSENPKNLDTSNLDTTPISEFETMGETDLSVDINKWRLQIDGKVRNPLGLTYNELKSLPVINKKVLLICPGFFAYHADWKGVSMTHLLERAGFDKTATRISFFGGPEKYNSKVDRFPIADVLSNKVFLAYEVNGKTLPQKHGYPLRVVAEDQYGGQWVKYVHKLNVD
jgi:DMSO/TMAO reductase YedYZ molybdopterin-dependent catalytic subunit